MTEKKRNTASAWVDPDDAPELTREWFEQADLYKGGKLVRRGRPLGSGQKKAISIRLDKDVLEPFRATGEGWQTRINDALRQWLKRHDPAKV